MKGDPGAVQALKVSVSCHGAFLPDLWLELKEIDNPGIREVTLICW